MRSSNIFVQIWIVVVASLILVCIASSAACFIDSDQCVNESNY